MRKGALIRIVSLVAGVSAVVAGGCTDPTRDREIEALGPDDPEGPGPEHRAGQPCVLCHSAGGPAETKAFAIAGTIYKTNKAGSPGADSVIVQFVDARNNGPRVAPQSGTSGNFYVPLADWPNVAFPVRVALYDTADGPPKATMQSLINREPSCNYCHQTNINPKDIDDETKRENAIEKTRTSAGQIFL